MISKYGRRWLLLMILPVVLVAAGLTMLVFVEQGRVEGALWYTFGVVLGGVGALFASLVTLVAMAIEPETVDGRNPEVEYVYSA